MPLGILRGVERPFAWCDGAFARALGGAITGSAPAVRSESRSLAAHRDCKLWLAGRRLQDDLPGSPTVADAGYAVIRLSRSSCALMLREIRRVVRIGGAGRRNRCSQEVRMIESI